MSASGSEGPLQGPHPARDRAPFQDDRFDDRHETAPASLAAAISSHESPTSAPQSASTAPAAGTNHHCATSTTRTPARTWLIGRSLPRPAAGPPALSAARDDEDGHPTDGGAR